GIQALRRWRARQSGRVGLVPTTGALHSGHQGLVTRARAASDLVVSSIFVHPLPFGADEDLVQYPRPIASDLAKCEEAGVDFVFAPALGEMYPSAPEVRVVAGRMGAVFEGEARPGHFDGVLTVVAKLFNLIKPDVTVFGLKDIQQFCLVKRMIADLDFDIRSDFVFAPALGEMYPSAPEVRVVAGRMGAVFEGEARPGHFDGVLTVVAKLFNLIKPDVTVFGLKDIQQFCLVKRMIADLDFDIEIIGLPVVRDADGLAMSSRNEYLSPSDRERALAIPRALDAAAEVAAGGVREGAASGGADSGEAVVESVADGVLPEAIE